MCVTSAWMAHASKSNKVAQPPVAYTLGCLRSVLILIVLLKLIVTKAKHGSVVHLCGMY